VRPVRLSGSLPDWCVTKDSFEFKEFFEPSFTPFSPVARLLVASKAATEVEPRAIDVYVACPNLLCDAASALDVSRCYVA
jgi:hypothetical protein